MSETQHQCTVRVCSCRPVPSHLTLGCRPASKELQEEDKDNGKSVRHGPSYALDRNIIETISQPETGHAIPPRRSPSPISLGLPPGS